MSETREQRKLQGYQKNETDLCPVAPGPLEGGECALLREEAAELAGVERWRQLYKIGLPGKSILRDYRAGLSICRKVLKVMFWEVPPAGGPLL